jgi:hypothetical protein
MTDAERLALDRVLGRSAPSGRTDHGGRWHPSDDERAACCALVRTPTRSFPWSLYTHCFTLRHMASALGLTTDEERHVRALVKGHRLITSAGVTDF